MSGGEPSLPDDIEAHAFAEPWQAEAFALAVALNQKSAFDWREWVEVFSGLPGDVAAESESGMETAYYKRWLSALEAIAVGHGLVSPPEIEARIGQWRRAYLRTPHGQPIELQRGLDVDPAHEEHHPDHHHAHGHHDRDHRDHKPARPVPVAISAAVASD